MSRRRFSSSGEVYGRADELDLIHNHNDYLAFPFARLTRTPTLTTSHGRLDIAEVRRLYGAFPEQRLISISDAQRQPLPDANWLATVYNGIDLGQFTYHADPEQYLLYLARINPEKRPDHAIEIARDAGMRLVMAAKIDPVDQAYYESAIAPMIRDCPLVEYVGEVGPAERDRLMGGACAYLFPIDWPGPFGLTMVEAMATGTPVIASRAGSVPEVVVDGVTGFICSTLTEMAAAIPRVRELDRRACRAHVEQRFTGAVMADGYERAYARLLDDVRSAAPSANGRGVVNSHPNRLARS